MNEQDMVGALVAVLQSRDGDEEFVDAAGGAEVAIESVVTFEDAGVMTNNRGFVVRLVNGDEFQITVVAS